MFHVNIQLRNYAAHVAVGAEACVTKTYERRDSCIWPTIKELLVLALHLEEKNDLFLQNQSPWQQQTLLKKVQCKRPKPKRNNAFKNMPQLGQDRAK